VADGEPPAHPRRGAQRRGRPAGALFSQVPFQVKCAIAGGVERAQEAARLVGRTFRSLVGRPTPERARVLGSSAGAT
jgi:hypothetical protein